MTVAVVRKSSTRRTLLLAALGVLLLDAFAGLLVVLGGVAGYLARRAEGL